MLRDNSLMVFCKVPEDLLQLSTGSCVLQCCHLFVVGCYVNKAALKVFLKVLPFLFADDAYVPEACVSMQDSVSQVNKLVLYVFFLHMTCHQGHNAVS